MAKTLIPKSVNGNLLILISCENVEEGKDKTVKPLAGLLNVEKSLL
jgi:hypothetical protein